MIKGKRPLFKPDYPVQIDWSNPLAKKLKGFWLFNETKGQIRNIVDGTVTTLTSGSPIQQVGRYGRELDHNAANGYPVFTNYDLPDEFSVFTLCKYNSNTIDHAVFDYATQSPVLWADTLSSQLRPALYSGVAVSYGSNNSLSTGTGYNTWGAIMRSNDAENRFFVNGDLQGVGNPGAWTTGTNTFRLLANNAGAKNSDSNTVWVIMFERALTWEEARWITRNPNNVYRLLKPVAQYKLFDVPAATTNVSATTGALTLAGLAASIALSTNITTTTGALTLAPLQATVTQGVNITASTGATTLAPLAASVSLSTNVAASTGALTLAPLAASVTQGLNVNATTGALTLAPLAATVSATLNISATTGALTLAPLAASVSTGLNVNATTGALTLAPLAAGVTVSTNVAATTGAITLGAYQATIGYPLDITATTGALQLVGLAADIQVGAPGYLTGTVEMQSALTGAISIDSALTATITING